MAVTGWTDYGLRVWNSTTGDETGIINCVNGAGTPGYLTRDINDGIGDFEFIVDIDTTPYGSGDKGGLVFCLDPNDYTKNYYITWSVDAYLGWVGGNGTIFQFGKDTSTGYSLITVTVGTQIDSGSIDDNSTTFQLKVVKEGSNVTVYHNGTQLYSMDGVPNKVFNDSTYSSGNIGFLYPDNSWSGTQTRFSFVSIIGGDTPRRRIMIIS